MAVTRYPHSQVREIARTLGLSTKDVTRKLRENAVTKKGINFLVTVSRNVDKPKNFENTLFDLVRMLKALTMTDLIFVGDLISKATEGESPNQGAMNMLVLFNLEAERRKKIIQDWGVTVDEEDGQIKPWIKAEKDPRKKDDQTKSEE